LTQEDFFDIGSNQGLGDARDMGEPDGIQVEPLHLLGQDHGAEVVERFS
jgi:hypothetical protein